MLFLFKEEKENKPEEFYNLINFEFIKCIAIIELYIKEKWIEPIQKNTQPFSLLYHQTMSFLYGVGAVKPQELAKQILTLAPFNKIDKEDYKLLLKHLLQKQELEKDEEGNLLIGTKAEGKVNNFQFFSVFSTPVEYSVREGSKDIGSVQTPYIIGQQFSLAGFTWKVLDINEEKRQIFVKKVGGISKILWSDDGEFYIHTRIMKKIKEILEDTEEYRYLDKNGLQKLKELRIFARKMNILNEKVVPIGEACYGIFPWIGTKEMLALSYSLKQEEIENQIRYRVGMPIFIEVKTKTSKQELEEILQKIKIKNIQKNKFEIPDNTQKMGKYNYIIPKELLEKQFKEDCIDVEGMQKNL